VDDCSKALIVTSVVGCALISEEMELEPELAGMLLEGSWEVVDTELVTWLVEESQEVDEPTGLVKETRAVVDASFVVLDSTMSAFVLDVEVVGTCFDDEVVLAVGMMESLELVCVVVDGVFVRVSDELEVSILDVEVVGSRFEVEVVLKVEVMETVELLCVVVDGVPVRVSEELEVVLLVVFELVVLVAVAVRVFVLTFATATSFSHDGTEQESTR